MSRLIELPLVDGGSVVVEVSDMDGADTRPSSVGPTTRGGQPADQASTPTMRGLGRREPLIESATQTLEESVATVAPALRAVLGELRRISDDLTQIELEVGLKLTGEAGMVLARVGTEANFQVHLTWTRSHGADSAGRHPVDAGQASG